MLLIVLVAVGVRVWQTRASLPLTRSGPNLVANNTFATDSDQDGWPDGWTSAFPDHKGLQRDRFTVQPNSGFSMFLAGSNNWLKSPWLAIKPGQSYRASLQALADDQSKRSATTVELWFHWRDARGTEFSIEYSEPQTVPFGQWALVVASRPAPPSATELAISIHPLTDDRIVVDQFSLAQTGVFVHQWPQGKGAALALSFDYETAMGGLVHSRSVDDPLADGNPQARALRMRSGAEALRALFVGAGVRGTFYTTGYNFLAGNAERRTFMADPTYRGWATTANGWPSDYWATHPWFSADPYSDEARAPGWYFGSQVDQLVAAGQQIESHTFAHFAGSYVTPADWRADLAAWQSVAAQRGVAAPTSLAFPWSSSAGMSAASWQMLADAGIASVTRTVWNQPRFVVADRTTYALRPLPADQRITVIADEYLSSGALPKITQRLAAAVAHGGALDVWAHTEEASAPTDLAQWAALITLAQPHCWIASVPEIVRYHQAVAQVSVRVRREQPDYVFRITNPSATDLAGLTLTLPFAPARLSVAGQPQSPAAEQLQLDLAAHQTLEITLWPA